MTLRTQRRKVKMPFMIAKTFACYRGHLGPSGPKLENGSENEFLGPLGPGIQKVETESKKSQNRRFFNYFNSVSSPFSTFWARGREAPGTHFRTRFPTLGAKGPNDPCSRSTESQLYDTP